MKWLQNAAQLVVGLLTAAAVEALTPFSVPIPAFLALGAGMGLVSYLGVREGRSFTSQGADQ